MPTPQQNNPNNTNNNQQAQQPPTQNNQQQTGGNVVRPQQTNTMNNAAAAPKQQQQQKTATPAKQPIKRSEKEQSSYERRFREFIKNRFGGMIGEILLNRELKNQNINDLSLLDEAGQMKVMDTVLQNIFKEHNMPGAMENTRLEMKLQLCLDKAAELMKDSYDDVELGHITVTHNDQGKLDRFSAETGEKFWSTSATTTGTLNSQAYIITPERETMMLMTGYAKNKKIDFNPLDEKQKKETLHRFFRSIFDPYTQVAKQIIGADVSYELFETSETNIDYIDGIKDENEKKEKESRKRTDVVSAEFTAELDRQKFPIIIFFFV
ncbi:MAG: hypothetical protein ACOCUR_02480 [Nanoarchaeota archaeon]